MSVIAVAPITVGLLLLVTSRIVFRSLKGRMEVSSSIKCNTLMSHQLVCSYDEFSLDCHMNRVLKTAGKILLRKSLSKQHQKALRRSLEYLASVSELDPHRIQWRRHYDRNSATYRMLMSVCKLVVDGHIHSQDPGVKRLEDFDEKTMSSLYEHFILEYFRREHVFELTASAPHIQWALDDDASDLLPDMRTDITLETKSDSPRKTLIIDAKYYAHSLQSRFEKKTVHSGNLYQIFTYVKNRTELEKRAGNNSVVAGMLLYAGTDEDIQPDVCYQMSGNEIRVATLRLDCEFDEISEQLDEIAEYLTGLEVLPEYVSAVEHAAVGLD